MLIAQAATLLDMDFQQRLAHAIAGCGTTPKAVATALGVSVQAISQTLSGATRALTAENCARAARFLQVDPYWLATGEGEARPKAVEVPDMSLSSEEKDLIVALRVLQASDRDQIVASVLDKARAQVAQLDALINRQQARIGSQSNIVTLPKR